MKTLTTLAALLALGLFSAGCSQEAQLENAQEDFAEERGETAAAVQEAQIGGATADDHSEIAEEQAEDVQAAGEVIKQEGELIEERVDN